MFAVIMFSKTSIPQQTVDGFKDLAAGTKEAIQSYVDGPVFAA